MAFTAHTVVEERGLSRELTRATDTLLARAFYILQCWGINLGCLASWDPWASALRATPQPPHAIS